ncbi:MAG: maltose alpha-D-glucosyltransferase [Acidobacteriota bacterium]|nr:maltose alpha-D-glucosyltransferase [Acidobacteriota bacterium]
MADVGTLREDPLWYKDAVFYEIYVRGFYDSDGDGIGDFRGLTQKLDYVQWLGVDCIWLLPMYPSPLRDGGYDIADYYSILPEYGTLADFREFLDAAHARGIRVIADLVVNHTSDSHPWFQEAISAPDSPKRDWYVWSQDPNLYHEARIIFTDTEKSNWTWHEGAQAFYWHRFFSHQPDLNYDNPEVQQAMLDVCDFWLDQGLDGFRVDAVPYLYEREGTNCENLPETHAFLRRLRAHVEAKHKNVLLLGEANQWPADVVEYFGGGAEFHMNYHFPIMPRLFMALRQEDRRPIVEILERTPDIPPDCQWGMFLRNHDELTLEMVADEERDYLYDEYAKDRRMRLNVGIRRRLAPLMDNSRRRIELLNGLLLSLPGSPFLYYGDEIGMGDNIYLGDRDGVRTPMQWSSDRNAGFSKADFEKLYFPVINNPVYGYNSVNVESQTRFDSSLLNWMRQMLHLRKEHHVFGRGSMRFVKPANRKIFAFTREHEGETVLCVFNLSQFAQPVELDLHEFEGRAPVEMLGKTRFPAVTAAPYQLALAPWGFYWFLLEPKAE